MELAVMRVGFAVAALAFISFAAHAQDLTAAKAAVKDEITTCSSRAVERLHTPLALLGWPDDCQSAVHDKCTAVLLNDLDAGNDKGLTQTCQTLAAEAWRAVNQSLQQHLVDRWQNCAISDARKAEIIGKIDRLDQAFEALDVALCDYDSGQWGVIGRSDIEDLKRSSCEVGAAVSRANGFYFLLLKDVGCAAD